MDLDKLKVILFVLLSSIVSVAAAWYFVPYAPLTIRLNLFELYTAASTVLSPCPTDEKLKNVFRRNRKEFEELKEIIEKKPWSKASQSSGRDIVRIGKRKVFSYDPWEIANTLEVTTISMKPEESVSVRNMMLKCGVDSIIKEDDGVIKFEFWSRVIPHMRLRKFLTYRDKSLAIEDYESSFQNFGSSNESYLSPIQKVYFPKQYYYYHNMVDGWGIEYGIM